MPRSFHSQDQLPPHVFYILLAVLDHGRHGYGIIKEIERLTGGEVVLGTSTLYAAIKRMVRSSMLEETERPAEADSEDSRRRYYQATESGRAALHREARRIRRLDRMLASARVLERTADAFSRRS